MVWAVIRREAISFPCLRLSGFKGSMRKSVFVPACGRTKQGANGFEQKPEHRCCPDHRGNHAFGAGPWHRRRVIRPGSRRSRAVSFRPSAGPSRGLHEQIPGTRYGEPSSGTGAVDAVPRAQPLHRRRVIHPGSRGTTRRGWPSLRAGTRPASMRFFRSASMPHPRSSSHATTSCDPVLEHARLGPRLPRAATRRR